MISSPRSLIEGNTQAKQGGTSNSWIELVAIPLASSIMDAQPIGLGIFVFYLYTFSTIVTADAGREVSVPPATIALHLITGLLIILLLALHYNDIRDVFWPSFC